MGVNRAGAHRCARTQTLNSASVTAQRSISMLNQHRGWGRKETGETILAQRLEMWADKWGAGSQA